MNATLLCVTLLVPGYGDEDIRKALEAAGIRECAVTFVESSKKRYGPYHALTFKGIRGTDLLLGELCELHGFEGLFFEKSDVTDAGMASIGGLRGLVYLSLNSIAVTDTGLQHLKGLSELTVLHLEKCHNLTDAGLEPLTRLSKLRYLDLRDCPNITDESIARLQKVLPNCKILRGPVP
jgi:hypothetical protein